MEYSYLPPDNETAFEVFCERLLAVYWPGSDPQRYGVKGQKQYGVDIIDMKAVDPLRAAQCRHKKAGKELAPEELTDVVGKAKQFRPEIRHYFVLTTSQRSAGLQTTVIRLNKEHRQAGLFDITLLTWDRIEEILRDHPGLWDRCVDPPVKRAIEPLERKVDALGHVVEGLAVQSVEDQYDARLESARQRLDEGDTQRAKILLRQLHTNRWNELSERQQFLTLTYLAKAEYAEANWAEAGRLYIRARRYQPEEERARVNEALGHELMGEGEAAHEMARELTDAFPRSSRPWAIVCRTAPEDVTAAQLEQAIPSHASTDVEVLVALAMRALDQGVLEAAQRLAERASDREERWAAPSLILAQARLQQLVRDGLKPAVGPLVTKDPSALERVIRVFDRAVHLAEQEGNRFLIISSLTERGRAKRWADDQMGADEDVAKVYCLYPSDGAVAYHYGNHLLQRGDIDAAIRVLRDAVTVNPRGDVKLTLALALREQDLDRHRAECTALAVDAASDREASLRLNAVQVALDGMLGAGRADEAESFVDRLSAEGLSKIAVSSFRVQVHLARDNRPAAAKEASAARAQVSETTDTEVVRIVADAHSRLGDHGDAVELWERVAEETNAIPDVRRLVEAAGRVGRYDVVRRVCREWREAGVSDLQLLHEELDVLERFAPHESLTILEREVRVQPDDRFLRLRLSWLALRLDRSDLVSRDLAQYPSVQEAGAESGSIVVRILAELGEFQGALEYAYDLLRHNQDSPQANLGLAFIVMASDVPRDLLAPPETVVPGTAVCFVESGSQEQQWRVIDRHGEGPAFPEDIEPDHPFARRLMGLRRGEAFVAAGDEIDGRRATVSELASKYVYRARRCMDEWQLRFQDLPAIEMFRISTPKEEDGATIPDFTPIIRRTHEPKRRFDDILRQYRESPATISLFARAIGRHFADTMEYLALSEDNLIRCCDGDPKGFKEAGRQAAVACGYVADLSAIVTLSLLGLEKELGDWPTKLIVSADTVGEIRSLRDRRKEEEKYNTWVFPTDGDLGIRFREISAEERSERREAVERLLRYVTKAADCRDCGELADLPPQQREELMQVCGQHGAESIVLAHTSGFALWTDDSVVAALGRHTFGVRRVWTQAVLARLASEGFLSVDEYRRSSARLIGYGYVATRFDAGTLTSAAELADWYASAWPLKQVLDALPTGDDPRANLANAGLFLWEVIKQPLVRPAHGQVVMCVLDRIADGPFGIAGVRALHTRLVRLLRFDIPGARQADRYFRQWLAVRGLDA